MINLDPNRPTTHVVIDNFDEIGREGVYTGSYEDCVEFWRLSQMQTLQECMK